MMFECCPRMEIYALRPHVLIYASKYIIWISLYWQFYETKLTEKWKNENCIHIVTLSPVTFSRTCIGWWSLHIHVPRIHEQHICTHFYNLANDRCTIDIYNLFKYIYIFSSMGRYSLQYVLYLSLSGIFWTSACLLIRILFLNQGFRLFFQGFIKLSSVLSTYLITRYAFTPLHAKNKNKIGWATRSFPMYSTNQFGT